MKYYKEEDLKNVINHIAAHYSMSGDNSFDSGVNNTVKEICKILNEFEKEKGIDNLHQQIFAGMI